jgi:hypothetical protein
MLRVLTEGLDSARSLSPPVAAARAAAPSAGLRLPAPARAELPEPGLQEHTAGESGVRCCMRV